MTDDTSAEALAKAEGRAAIEAAARIALVWRNPQLRSAMHPWTMASPGQREQAIEAAEDTLKAYLAALPGWRLVNTECFGAVSVALKLSRNDLLQERFCAAVGINACPPGLEE